MPLCKEEEFEDDEASALMSKWPLRKAFFMAFTRAQWLLEDTTAYRSCAEEFKKIIESDEDDDLLLLDEKI